MNKEKDEITSLFRSRLVETEMTVRDGFWEELSQDIPVAYQHRRRLLFFRVAAVASVLLVLGASSAAFWYFSPKEEIEEAFTQLAVANGGGVMDGDGVRANPLPQAIQPVLPKPAPKAYGMLSQYSTDEDSVSVTVSMSFSFSATTSVGRQGSRTNRGNRFFQMADQTQVADATTRDEQVETPRLAKAIKIHHWAVKAQLGTALPVANGNYQMPVSAGVTIERKLNDYFGVETGLLYSSLRSEEQKLHYMGIPVRMNVTLARTDKVDLYATIGALADKCIAGAPNNSFNEEPIQLAVTAGVGINYKLNDRLAIFAEPGVSYHFNTDSKLQTVRTKRPTNFNLLCGIRMTY